MKSCLNATTLNQNVSFTDFVRIAGAAGFAGVEVRLGPVAEMASTIGVEGVKHVFDEAHIIPAHCALSASPTRSDSDFDAALALAPAECELALALGIPTAMIVLPYRRDRGESDPARLVKKIRAVADIAAAHGVGLTLEFIGLRQPDGLGDGLPTTLGRTVDLVEAVDRPNVGVLIDAYHWYVGGSQSADLRRIPRGLPLFVHINDAPPGPIDTLTDPMRVLPGEGVIDVVGWLNDIKSVTGYDGYASLELFNPAIRELDPVDAAKRSATSVDRILSKLAR